MKAKLDRWSPASYPSTIAGEESSRIGQSGVGYLRGYRRGQAELRRQLEDTNRQTKDTLDQLRKSNAKTREYLAVTRAARREIAQVRASYGLAETEPDPPIRLN